MFNMNFALGMLLAKDVADTRDKVFAGLAASQFPAGNMLGPLLLKPFIDHTVEVEKLRKAPAAAPPASGAPPAPPAQAPAQAGPDLAKAIEALTKLIAQQLELQNQALEKWKEYTEGNGNLNRPPGSGTVPSPATGTTDTTPRS